MGGLRVGGDRGDAGEVRFEPGKQIAQYVVLLGFVEYFVVKTLVLMQGLIWGAHRVVHHHRAHRRADPIVGAV